MKQFHALGALLLWMQLSVASPAQASVAAFMGVSLGPAAALGWTGRTVSSAPCSARPGNLMALPGHETAGLRLPSKASSIMGGRPSKLELISAQQTGRTELTESIRGVRVEPAAGGVRCPGASPSFGAMPAATLSLRAKQDNPEDFLASARLPLHKTIFDRQWNKVRRAGLSANSLVGLSMPRHASPDMAMLSAVNAWANRRVRYVEDKDQYGKTDVWATARDTLRRGAGDCEDIAIVKMQALGALGVPSGDMFLTIARDTVRHADHALLIIRFGDRYWMLDNATDSVLDASYSYDYRPIMSFSTSGKWLHGYQHKEPAGTGVEGLPAIARIALR